MVGLLSSFFGVGGGVIIVPALYDIFPSIPPQVIIASSIGVIFINSWVNTYNLRKHGKKAEWKIILLLGVGLGVGIQVGKMTSYLIPATLLKQGFGAMLIMIALKDFFYRPKQYTEGPPAFITKPVMIKLFIIGVISGLIAGLTGLGGGIVIVPALILLLKIPSHWVSSYSNPAMGIGTFVGLVSFSLTQTKDPILWDAGFLNLLQLGLINWGVVAFLVVLSSLTSPYGAKLTGIISRETSKKIFATLLVILALKMFL